MRTLFVTTLIAFLSAFLLLTFSITIFFYFGFQSSLNNWQNYKMQEIESIVRDYLNYLQNNKDATETDMPDDIPLFIYNSEKELIYTNRGRGLRRQAPDLELIPINSEIMEEKSTILGYYSVGEFHFIDDKANSAFLESSFNLIWINLFFSFCLSLIFAFFFSKGLSASSKKVADSLRQIASGFLDIRIPEKGAKEIKYIAQATNKLAQQLKKEKELRNQWAHDITHDLRTPVSALRAQFEGMKDGLLDLTTNRIEKNIKEISNLEVLIKYLEELMKLETPGINVKNEKIMVQELINEIINRFSADIKKKGIKIKTGKNIDFFYGDNHLLNRALSNIVSNAVRFTDKKGKIIITFNKRNALNKPISIRIFNSGRGILENEQSKVFDRLFRGEYSRNSHGTGLGLSIVKQIARLHNGNIYFINKPGIGITFVLDIP